MKLNTLDEEEEEEDMDENDRDLLDRYGRKLTSILSSPSSSGTNTKDIPVRVGGGISSPVSFSLQNNDTLSSTSFSLRDKYRHEEDVSLSPRKESNKEKASPSSFLDKDSKKRPSPSAAAAPITKSLLSVSTSFSLNDKEEGEEIEVISPCTAASGMMSTMSALTFNSSLDLDDDDDDERSKDEYRAYATPTVLSPVSAVSAVSSSAHTSLLSNTDTHANLLENNTNQDSDKLSKTNSNSSGSNSSLQEKDYHTSAAAPSKTQQHHHRRSSTPLRSNQTNNTNKNKAIDQYFSNDSDSIDSNTSFPPQIKKKLSPSKKSKYPDILNSKSSVSFMGSLNTYGDNAIMDDNYPLGHSIEQEQEKEKNHGLVARITISEGDTISTHSTLHSNDYNISSDSKSEKKDKNIDTTTPNDATTKTLGSVNELVVHKPKTPNVSPPSAHNGGHYPNNPDDDTSPPPIHDKKKEKEDEDNASLGSYLPTFEGMQEKAIEKIHTSWALDNPCHTLEEVIQDMNCQTFPFFHHPTTQEPVYTRDAAIFTLATKCEYCGSLSTDNCNPKHCKRPQLYFLKKKSPFDTWDNGWDRETGHKVDDLYRFEEMVGYRKNDLVASSHGGHVVGGGATTANSRNDGTNHNNGWSTTAKDNSPPKRITTTTTQGGEQSIGSLISSNSAGGNDDSISWTSSFVGKMGKFVTSPSWGTSSHT